MKGGNMRRIAISIVLLSLLFLNSFVLAQPVTNEDEDGRYIVHIMNGRAMSNTRVPALVLDTVRGVVWTCQNLQDGKPLWVKADLGQNGDKSLTRRKYVVKMLEWQDADLRMPAIVLDIDEGIVWTCQNIIDGKARWVERDLTTGVEKEISREELAIIKK
jgi:hypothetical protein